MGNGWTPGIANASWRYADARPQDFPALPRVPDRRCLIRIFTTAAPLSACQQPTGRDNALHGSCLTVARIDSPFRVWAVPFLFSQCHLFQKIPYQYVDIRFHRRGVFAPVYCRTINYGSDCLLGPLNVSSRDILFPSAEKISRPPCGQLVFFLSRANIPFAPDTEVVQRASKTIMLIYWLSIYIIYLLCTNSVLLKKTWAVR